MVGPERKTIITLDLDLYSHALQIQQSVGNINWVLRVGTLHIVFAALHSLGKTVNGSGIDTCTIESSIYICLALWGIYNGKAYKRGIEYHITTSLAMTMMKFDAMFAVTQPLYESRMNWVYDPAPPASRRATVDFSDTPVNSNDTPVNAGDTPASGIINASPGAPLASSHPKKSRRRRRRRNRRSANQNSAPPVTPDERWANKNSASQRATQPQSAASDPSQMMSTPVYQHQSFHSSHLPQPPVPAANRNSAFQFGLDRCRFPGLYKPAHPDPRQDLTATLTRVNNSGSGFSSPSLLQPCTKPFSGLPARQQMTCPKREAGEATRERPGVVYPLLPRAQRPDTRVVIEASLPEAAALDRRAQPPTVLEIGDTSLPQQASSPRRRFLTKAVTQTASQSLDGRVSAA